MANKNTTNLIPQSERTKEKQREIARMGGIASGQAKREKKTIQKIFSALCESKCSDIPQFQKIANKLGLQKDANIKAWIIAEYNENEKKKFDPVFIKFLPWMCPTISKDFNIARTQIRKAEMTFKSWNTDMFSFMDDSAVCPSCGEEVTARLRFPDGVGALFNVVNRRKKFGTK